MTADAPPKTKQMTEYYIISWDAATYGWKPCKLISAPSGPAAIRIYVADNPLGDDATEAQFVAVPTRSWKPVKVTVHTETTVRLG